MIVQKWQCDTRHICRKYSSRNQYYHAKRFGCSSIKRWLWWWQRWQSSSTRVHWLCDFVRCFTGVLPTSCQDLQTMDELLLDDYFRFRVISPADGSTVGEVILYCVMSTTPAKSFLPLPAGRATNYATTDWRHAYNQKICGSSFRTNPNHGRTEFVMINVIPATIGQVRIMCYCSKQSTRSVLYWRLLYSWS